MGQITKLLSGKETKNLAMTRNVGQPVSMKSSPESSDLPVSGFELERAYRKDPICFNAINKNGQMIMAAGHEFTDASEGNLKKFQDFFDNIGMVGEDITEDELWDAIYKYQMIYGSAYIELVFNKSMTKVVDLTIMDSKRVDYAKDNQNRIAVDRFGKPIGYVLKLPYGIKAEGDEIPEEHRGRVQKDSNEIFMLPIRIAHFKLYTAGDRFYAIGLIEPAYKSILRKMNIEEDQTNSIYSRGTYPVIAYVGDQTHDPSPQDIDTVLNNLVKLKHDRYMAFQNWVKVEPLEVKQSDVVDQTLEYLRLNQTASLGMPIAFAVGAGEKTNRATLNNQQKFMEFTQQDIVNKTVSTFRKSILKRIAFFNKISEVPNIKWGNIGTEDTDAKSIRLVSYINAQVLKPDDVTEFAKTSEGLK